MQKPGTQPYLSHIQPSLPLLHPLLSFGHNRSGSCWDGRGCTRWWKWGRCLPQLLPRSKRFLFSQVTVQTPSYFSYMKMQMRKMLLLDNWWQKITCLIATGSLGRLNASVPSLGQAPDAKSTLAPTSASHTPLLAGAFYANFICWQLEQDQWF